MTSTTDQGRSRAAYRRAHATADANETSACGLALRSGIRAEVVQSPREPESGDARRDPQTKVTVSILVVDDDEAVLRTTLRMLDALGYAAVPAASGRGEALRLAASGLEIDLVLADFAMPEMTGAELAKTIHNTHPALPACRRHSVGASAHWL